MTETVIIDAHVHTYKTAGIAMQAMGNVNRSGCSGTPEELLQIMKRYGIGRSVQVNMTPALSMYNAGMANISKEGKGTAHNKVIETVVGRILRRNQWTCELAATHFELVPFISVDPLMKKKEIVAEIEEKVIRQGAKGLKIHPAEGCYFPNDARMWPAYEVASRLGIPVITHGGRFSSDKDYTRPYHFKKILEKFPKLTLVIAHLGLGYWDESIELAKTFGNVFFDTAAAVHGTDDDIPLSDDEAVKLIRSIGTKRVMFGSDYPWYHPGKDLERFLKLDFSEKEMRALLCENAERILKL